MPPPSRRPPPLPLAERFYRKVSQRPLEEGGCWIWQGAYSEGRRYRAPVIREAGTGSRILRVVRWVLLMKTGESGEGLEAGHLCDNPSCVNPDHLRWVTGAENLEELREREWGWEGRMRWSVEKVVREVGGWGEADAGTQVPSPPPTFR